MDRHLELTQSYENTLPAEQGCLLFTQDVSWISERLGATHWFLEWQKVPSILDEKGRSPCSAHHRCHVLLSRCLALAMAGLSCVTLLLVMFLQGKASGNRTDIHHFPSFSLPLRTCQSCQKPKGIHWGGIQQRLLGHCVP